MKYKAFSTDVSVKDGERAVSAVISTSAVDRDGEVLIPQGANWKDFQANPVIFYNHCYADWAAEPEDKLPVGKATAITRDKESISFKMVFVERPAAHPEGEEWLPDTLFSLYQQGVMRAFSVGFLPVETRAATDKDLLTFGTDCRRVISKWKLLEVSCVPLPCNQEAVATAVSKGLITRERAKTLFGKSGEVTEEAIAAAGAAAETPAEPEAKADDEKPAMGTCAKCQKEMPLDDMEEVDGEMMCPDCKGAKAADPDPAPAAADEVPQKHVVREIEPAPDEDAYEIKHVHRVILPDDGGRAEKHVKIVHRHLAKMRGRVYHAD